MVQGVQDNGQVLSSSARRSVEAEQVDDPKPDRRCPRSTRSRLSHPPTRSASLRCIFWRLLQEPAHKSAPKLHGQFNTCLRICSSSSSNNGSSNSSNCNYNSVGRKNSSNVLSSSSSSSNSSNSSSSSVNSQPSPSYNLPLGLPSSHACLNLRNLLASNNPSLLSLLQQALAGLRQTRSSQANAGCWGPR